MNGKRILLLLLAGCLIFPLAGCRVRTGGSGQETGVSAAGSGPEAAGAESPDGSAGSDVRSEAADSGDAGETGSDDAAGRTRENPEADRKEYDPDAAVEVEPGTDRPLAAEGEGIGAPVADGDAEDTATRLDENAEEPATRTVAAEEAEQKGVSEDAEAADSALTFYTVLLRDRLDSLFECERLNLYWETAEDHVTVHKSSPVHALILGAGAYDVSARLLPENLRVDDGWISRKNPGIIVKIVPAGVLGPGVDSVSAAEPVRRSLLAREGWSDIDAVRNGKVLLLSGELLQAPWLQVAAQLMIAKTAYPSLFPDLDLSEALRLLSGEAAGASFSGIYGYPEP